MTTPPLAVAACVSPRRKQRLQDSLAADVRLRFYDSFAELRGAAANGLAPIVILDAHDRLGESAAATLTELGRPSMPHTLLLYASARDLRDGVMTGQVADIIIADVTDTPALLQALLHRVSMKFAAGRVVEALRDRLKGPLAMVAETAVRQPSCTSVESLAARIGVQRQTLAAWCRAQQSLRPEELLMWCRILLVSALLEETGFSISALAVFLEFPSAIALRNQLKRYTGLTGLQVRDAGLEAILARFDEARSATPRSGIPQPQGISVSG